MKRKQVWQYQCDFCGKRNLSGGHMKSHEKHCTGNPDRICRFHAHCEDTAQPPMRELVAILRQNPPECALPLLRERASDCPCCILAALRATGLNKGTADEEGYTPPAIEYNFKAEMEQKWKDINDARLEEVDCVNF